MVIFTKWEEGMTEDKDKDTFSCGEQGGLISGWIRRQGNEGDGRDGGECLLIYPYARHWVLSTL